MPSIVNYASALRSVSAMRVCLFVVSVSLTSAVTAVVNADTHRFVPEKFYNTYSFAHPPALRIKPGDRVDHEDDRRRRRRLERQDRSPAARIRRPGRSSSRAPSRATCWSSRSRRSRPTARWRTPAACWRPTPSIPARSPTRVDREPRRVDLDDRQGARRRAARSGRRPAGRHRAAAAADARLHRRRAGAQGSDLHRDARRLRRQHGLRVA